MFVAIVFAPPHNSILGYVYLGEDFTAFREEFSNVPFSIAKRDSFVTLDGIPNLNRKCLATHPELREAIRNIDSALEKEKEAREKLATGREVMLAAIKEAVRNK